MSQIITLKQEIESSFLKTKIEIDNSCEFKDFKAFQQYADDKKIGPEKIVSVGIDTYGRTLILNGVSLEGSALQLFKDFINQI